MSCSITISCSTIEENTFYIERMTQTKFHQLYQNKVLMFLVPVLYQIFKHSVAFQLQSNLRACYIIMQQSHLR